MALRTNDWPRNQLPTPKRCWQIARNINSQADVITWTFADLNHCCHDDVFPLLVEVKAQHFLTRRNHHGRSHRGTVTVHAERFQLSTLTQVGPTTDEQRHRTKQDQAVQAPRSLAELCRHSLHLNHSHSVGCQVLISVRPIARRLDKRRDGCEEPGPCTARSLRRRSALLN